MVWKFLNCIIVDAPCMPLLACPQSLNEILELGIDMVEILVFRIIFISYYFELTLVPTF